MTTSAQRRALQSYRSRLVERGMARFEVQGLDRDRVLIRSLARKLAEDGPDAERTRALAESLVTNRGPGRGRVLAALRRSPFVGADLDLERSYEAGRDLDL